MIAGMFIGFADFYSLILHEPEPSGILGILRGAHYRVGAFFEKDDCRLLPSLLRDGHEPDGQRTSNFADCYSDGSGNRLGNSRRLLLKLTR